MTMRYMVLESIDFKASHETLFYLLSALVALMIAPIVHRVLERAQRPRSVLNGFVIGSIALLVIGHILPEAVELAGNGALLTGLAGLAAPLAIEALVKRSALGTRLTTVLIVCALLAHAFLDGVAVGSPTAHPALGSAVVLHKLPEGLMVWMMIQPRSGGRVAFGLLALVAGATISGGLVGELPVSAQAQGLFNAFVGGALLHVVGSEHGASRSFSHPQWELFGALLGGGLVWATFGGHLHVPDAERLLALLLETAPALVLGFTLAGLIVAFLPKLPSRWLNASTPLGQAGRGVVFGLPLPICSCGVVPVYEGLVRRGAPVTASMAFLVATPELGPDSLLLSLPLLGPELTGIRLMAALILALLVGVFVGSRTRSAPLLTQTSYEGSGSDVSFRGRLAQAAHGLKAVVDDTSPWILLGLFAAAWIDPQTMGMALAGLPHGLDVVAAALGGIPLYICASGATPLAAALLLLGLSPGAALALLLAGPATNVTTFGVLSRCHGVPTAALFGASVLGLAVSIQAPPHQGAVLFGKD